jgi:hypothetical protein
MSNTHTLKKDNRAVCALIQHQKLEQKCTRRESKGPWLSFGHIVFSTCTKRNFSKKY